MGFAQKNIQYSGVYMSAEEVKMEQMTIHPQDNTIITLEHVSFSYSEQKEYALEDISLDVHQGEFLCILGQNGSGKSTLAKLLNALYVPTKGRVLVNGIDTSKEGNEWDVRKACGMVFQNPDNQMVATIVEEDVAFGMENLGIPSPEIRERVDEALKMVNMSEFALSAPHMLSGGQKQRVAVAGVLAMRPKVIVFDEATAMLDPAGRTQVMQVVQRLNDEENITVVWITHFMDEASMADRLIVMNHGHIAMEGIPSEVFSQGDQLRTLGMDVPEVTALADRLRAKGVHLPKGITNVSEMVVELCRLK